MARPIQKRQDIERGVVAVVARKGLRGTTIQDIADEAHVSPGLLYRYWKNRDELAADVYQAHYQSLIERLAALSAGQADPWKRLCLMIRGFLEFADESSTVLKFLLLSQHDLHGSIPVEKGIYTFLMQFIVEDMESGRIRRIDPNLALQFLLGIVLQPVVGALYGDISPPMTSYYEEIVDALERVLLSDHNNSTTDRNEATLGT